MSHTQSSCPALVCLCRSLPRCLLLTGALIVGVISTAQAQPTAVPPATDQPGSDPSTMSLEQLLGVEVESVFGASKALQKITEAPASVTVVTAEDIERFGWRTLADVMRNVRGFYVTSDRTYAFIGARGFQPPGDYSTRVLVTVDGVRLNDVVYEQALLEEDLPVDLSTVERIEFIRGPSSSLYGTSAFFGIVNITTRAADRGPRLEATVAVGSLGWKETRLRGHHEFTNGASVSISGVLVNASGASSLYFPEYVTPETNNGIVRDRDYTRRRNVQIRADYKSVTVSAIHNARRRGMPTAAYDSIFGYDASAEDRHDLIGASWQRALGHGWTGTLRGAYDRYRFIGTYGYVWDTARGPAVVDYIDRSLGQFLSGEVQFARTFGTAHQVTGGVEHRANLDQDQFSYIREPYEDLWSDRRGSNTTGLYIQDQWRITRRVLVNAGLRVDHYARFKDPVKPRLALIVQPTDRTTMKLVYGGAFRAPSAYENFYETPGLYKASPDLGPEQIRSVEGILEHYAGRRVRLSASVYHNTVSNLITLRTDPADGLYSYANGGAVHATGMEAEADAKWPGGLQGRVSYGFGRAIDPVTGSWIVNSPRHVTQALLAVPLRDTIFLSMELQALSDRTDRNGNRVGAYVRPSMTLSGAVGARARVGFTVWNVTNTRFADPVGDDYHQASIARDGRTARLQLSIAF